MLLFAMVLAMLFVMLDVDIGVGAVAGVAGNTIVVHAYA